jgi:hypothetical protein
MTITRDDAVLSAHWMEHQILGHIKQALRVTLDWKAPVVSMPRKLSSVRFTMKSFQRHLERTMKLEEVGGYLSVVADSKPNLYERVNMLVGDHDRFRCQLCEVMPLLESVSQWNEDAFDEVCNRLRALLDEVDLHDAAEIELLQESLLMDEGGEG